MLHTQTGDTEEIHPRANYNLLHAAENTGLQLETLPSAPTRTGNSVSADTVPRPHFFAER